MVIEQVAREDILKVSRESLGLSPSTAPADDELLAALLRRAASIRCPCSPATLIDFILDGLQYLLDDRNTAEARLADLVDKLMVTGDLLELNQVTTDDPDVKSTWIFAAPPSFVARPDGTLFLLGIVPDYITPLPASLSVNVLYEGVLRVLMPESSQDARRLLREFGWLELSCESWLKAPKLEPPAQQRDAMRRRLDEQPASGAIADLMILDSSRDPRRYSRRRVRPTHQSGHFVARRPQAHGAPIWGYAELADGMPARFLDFPLKGTRWRGCDVAWHLQMAIDEGLGTPQVYRRRDGPGGTYFDFFSPLPLWAARRLAVLGHTTAPDRCLVSYWLPSQDVDMEEEFLRQRLWLKRSDH
jgi:hypothetical protein